MIILKAILLSAQTIYMKFAKILRWKHEFHLCVCVYVQIFLFLPHYFFGTEKFLHFFNKKISSVLIFSYLRPSSKRNTMTKAFCSDPIYWFLLFSAEQQQQYRQQKLGIIKIKHSFWVHFLMSWEDDCKRFKWQIGHTDSELLKLVLLVVNYCWTRDFYLVRKVF